MNDTVTTRPTKELKTIPVEETKLSTSTQEMKSFLKEEAEKRKILEEYITQNLKAGVDFGTIDIKYKDKQTGVYKTVKSKPTLFKPGAEKICSLLHLRPQFKIDKEMIEIVGANEVAFICELVKETTGEIVGEGRGSCGIKEKGVINSAIKIGKKRAVMDAVLSVAALSDRFSQDLEDKDVQNSIRNQYEGTPRTQAKPPVKKQDNFSGPVEPDMIARITKMLKYFGATELDLIAKQSGSKTGDFADLESKKAYWLLKNAETCLEEAKTKKELSGDIPPLEAYSTCPKCSAKFQAIKASKFGEDSFYIACCICKGNTSLNSHI